MRKGFHDERYRRLIRQLVAARNDYGLSQAQLAIKLGTHQQFVSRYETGERRLDVIEFITVCEALQLDVRNLLGAA